MAPASAATTTVQVVVVVVRCLTVAARGRKGERSATGACYSHRRFINIFPNGAKKYSDRPKLPSNFQAQIVNKYPSAPLTIVPGTKKLKRTDTGKRQTDAKRANHDAFTLSNLSLLKRLRLIVSIN